VHLRDRVGQLHRLHADVACRNTLFNGRAQSGARYFKSLMDAGMRRFRIELLDEDRAAADRTIRAYQQMIHSQISADELMLQVKALEKLGVTEGTLASIS
jgi:putative protease